MKKSLTEAHEHLNTTWVSSWAIIVVLDCGPVDEDLGSRYYKRMIAMIMTMMMRRMGLMMTMMMPRTPLPPGCAPHRPLPD